MKNRQPRLQIKAWQVILVIGIVLFIVVKGPDLFGRHGIIGLVGTLAEVDSYCTSNPTAVVYDSGLNSAQRYCILSAGSPASQCSSQITYTFLKNCGSGTQTCTDTDSSTYPTKNYNVKGTMTVIGYDPRTDYCAKDITGGSTEAVMEYYCTDASNYGPAPVSYDCASVSKICSSGACVSAPGTCTDSDPSNNVFIEGTVSDSQGTYNDKCTTAALLTQYNCTGNVHSSLSYSCPVGWTCAWGTCTSKDGYCQFNDNCNTGNTCVNSACEPQCADTCASKGYVCGSVCNVNCGTCASGTTCSNGKCMADNCGSKLGEQCGANGMDCCPGLICTATAQAPLGTCIACQTDADCGANYKCQSGTCVVSYSCGQYQNGQKICGGSELTGYQLRADYIYVCTGGEWVESLDCGSGFCVGSTTPTCCTPSWTCGNWSACDTNGEQTRTCTDASSCNTILGRPNIRRACLDEPDFGSCPAPKPSDSVWDWIDTLASGISSCSPEGCYYYKGEVFGSGYHYLAKCCDDLKEVQTGSKELKKSFCPWGETLCLLKIDVGGIKYGTCEQKNAFDRLIDSIASILMSMGLSEDMARILAIPALVIVAMFAFMMIMQMMQMMMGTTR